MKKKRFAMLLSCVAIVATLASCGDNPAPSNTTADETYLAGGTIPASAKIYDIIDEDLHMTVVDENKVLTDDDIWTLTYYVDLFATGSDTRGKGWQKDEVAKFVDSETIQNMEEAQQSSTYDYEVQSVQILALQVIDKQTVQAVCVQRVQGFSPKAQSEGQYDIVNVWTFAKGIDSWHFAGKDYLCTAISTEIEYSRDSITGKYTINPFGQYWT